MIKKHKTPTLFSGPSQKPINRFYKSNKQNVSCSREDIIAVAEDIKGDIIAAGFIRPLPSGQYILRGVFVDVAHRKKQLGQSIVSLLLTHYEGEIWLQCKPELNDYYQRYNFKAVVVNQEVMQSDSGMAIKKGHILMHRP